MELLNFSKEESDITITVQQHLFLICTAISVCSSKNQIQTIPEVAVSI